MTFHVQKRRLLGDATTLGTGLMLRVVIQAATFVLVARVLGASVFGAFAAITAINAMLWPFSGLGSPIVFIRNVRSGRTSPAVCWGNGLVLTVLSGTLLAGIAFLASFVIHLPFARPLISLFCISDLILMRVTELATFGFRATNHMRKSAIQCITISVLRLSAIGILDLYHCASPSNWAWAYFASSVGACGYALYDATVCWGVPEIKVSEWRRDVSEGIFFSISASAQTMYDDLDKSMLGWLSTLSATGIYTAAYRVIDTAMTPIKSVLAAAHPRFFEIGTQGVGATFAYARRLIWRSLAYGILAFLTIWVAAPVIPLLLGAQYREAYVAVRWLSLIPLMRCCHLFLADSLSGAGYQRTRAMIQVGVGILNAAANLVILPRFSWRGAAWTSLVCDGMLVLSMWTANILLAKPLAPVRAVSGAKSSRRLRLKR